MFFILSKTVAYLLLPSNFLIAAGLVGLALMATGWRRAGKRIALASLALLLGLGILPVGKLFMNALEKRFPPWDAAAGAPDGIIVLGGAIDPKASLDRGRTVVGGNVDRIFAIARLARQLPAARIIYSGGNGSLIPGGPPEADFLYPLLDGLGVPRERVVLESRSRNTEGNAIFSKAIANPKRGERWLLVTSAWHMPRRFSGRSLSGGLADSAPCRFCPDTRAGAEFGAHRYRRARMDGSRGLLGERTHQRIAARALGAG